MKLLNSGLDSLRWSEVSVILCSQVMRWVCTHPLIGRVLNFSNSGKHFATYTGNQFHKCSRETMLRKAWLVRSLTCDKYCLHVPDTVYISQNSKFLSRFYCISSRPTNMHLCRFYVNSDQLSAIHSTNHHFLPHFKCPLFACHFTFGNRIYRNKASALSNVCSVQVLLYTCTCIHRVCKKYFSNLGIFVDSFLF